MLTLITMPSGANMLADISEYSAPIFTDLFATMLPIIGIILAIGLVGFIVKIFMRYLKM